MGVMGNSCELSQRVEDINNGGACLNELAIRSSKL
jgi:hypothetical protein